MPLHFDKMLYFDLDNEILVRPYQMFTRAAGSTPLLYMFDSLPVLVIATARPAQPTFCDFGVTMTMLCNYYRMAGAAYSSGTAMAIPVFLLNNRFQFQEIWSQNFR